MKLLLHLFLVNFSKAFRRSSFAGRVEMEFNGDCGLALFCGISLFIANRAFPSASLQHFSRPFGGGLPVVHFMKLWSNWLRERSLRFRFLRANFRFGAFWCRSRFKRVLSITLDFFYFQLFGRFGELSLVRLVELKKNGSVKQAK